jgi:redox-sensing transcriptional repressor
MAKQKDISPLTIQRLSLYLRALREMRDFGEVSASSKDIAERVGSTAPQIRKDLSYFGSFGQKGRGYKIDELIATLEKILGVDKKWKVALVGVGKLGQSLLQYKGFWKSGFEIAAIFEKDPGKIGRRILGIPIYPTESMPKICEQENILMAIITVPFESAEEAFQRALDSGIRGILNFTGYCCFKPPPHAFIKDVNMSAEIEALSYYISTY